MRFLISLRSNPGRTVNQNGKGAIIVSFNTMGDSACQFHWKTVRNYPTIRQVFSYRIGFSQITYQYLYYYCHFFTIEEPDVTTCTSNYRRDECAFPFVSWQAKIRSCVPPGLQAYLCAQQKQCRNFYFRARKKKNERVYRYGCIRCTSKPIGKRRDGFPG